MRNANVSAANEPRAGVEALVSALCLALALLQQPAAATPPPRPTFAAEALRGRWHFVFENGLGASAFEYSLLFTRSELGDETRLLVSSAPGKLELISRQDPKGHDSTEIVRDAETKETLTRRIIFAGGPRVPGCEDVEAPDPCILFSSARGNFSTSLSAFSGRDGAGLRGRAAALVSDDMTRRLKSYSAIFKRSVEFEAYVGDFLGLVWPDDFKIGRGKFAPGVRRPGCDFDAAFGHPCSDRERAREEKRFSN